MNNETTYITILTVNHPNELVVIKARLESEGVLYNVKDELLTQINPFYSNAIGGVKLQVKEEDLQQALKILEENGFTIENNVDQFDITKLDKLTSKILFLNKLRFETRLIILALLFAFLFSTIIYFATAPTVYERLTKHGWCLENVIYKDENFVPKTKNFIKFNMDGAGDCEEKIIFSESGRVFLPGFNTSSIRGGWKMVDDKHLQIFQTDTFEFVYNGFYEIDFSNNGLVLKSDITTLNCYDKSRR